MTVTVFAPASIGNVSVGFDILGLAVKPVDGTMLGDLVSAQVAEQDELTVIGEFAKKLPGEPTDNIVWHCLQLFNQQMISQEKQVSPVKLTLEKRMPVGSGLGSSACSVVAALVALNRLYDDAFSQKQLLVMMGQMEAQISGSLHYDNVAPCFLGGLQLMVPDEKVISRTLPDFDDCYYVMAYPGIEVSTKAAREVLPEQYSKSDIVRHGQNIATFVDACHRQDKQQAFNVVEDVIAESYRQHLLPKFEQAKAYLLEQQALAVGISGSGPTLFCVYDQKDKAEQMANWLKDNYLQTELGFVHVCKADQQGACQINSSTVEG